MSGVCSKCQLYSFIQSWLIIHYYLSGPDVPHILCFSHCSKQVFSIGQLPDQCPSCHTDLTDCQLDIPPFALPSPFKRALELNLYCHQTNKRLKLLFNNLTTCSKMHFVTRKLPCWLYKQEQPAHCNHGQPGGGGGVWRVWCEEGPHRELEPVPGG